MGGSPPELPGFYYDATVDRYFPLASPRLSAPRTQNTYTAFDLPASAANSTKRCREFRKPLRNYVQCNYDEDLIFAYNGRFRSRTANAYRSRLHHRALTLTEQHVIRRYPNGNGISTFLPDGHSRIQCKVLAATSSDIGAQQKNWSMKIMGCSPTVLALASYSHRFPTAPDRLAVWRPEDALCGSVRGAISPDGNLTVGVVSCGSYRSRFIAFKNNISATFVRNTSGIVEDVLVTNAAAAFTAGQGLNGFDVHCEKAVWSPKTVGLPDFRSLAADNTTLQLFIAGHRAGVVSQWDVRQSRAVSRERVCAKTIGVTRLEFLASDSEALISLVDGSVGLYDLRNGLSRGPCARFLCPGQNAKFLGGAILGQFCVSEQFRVLAAVQQPNCCNVYSLSPSAQNRLGVSFPLPFPDDSSCAIWGHPFFVPSVALSTIASEGINAHCFHNLLDVFFC